MCSAKNSRWRRGCVLICQQVANITCSDTDKDRETEVLVFARVKKSGPYQYVQVVHNERIEGRVRQRVIATLGRLDALKETGQLEGLLESLARFSDHAAVLLALKTNQITPTSTVHLGPPVVFQKLWECTVLGMVRLPGHPKNLPADEF